MSELKSTAKTATATAAITTDETYPHETVTEILANLTAAYLSSSNLRTSTPHEFSGYTTVEYRFQAPLDYSAQYFAAFQLSDTQRALLPSEITVFAREYIRTGGEELPRLVYFQGGPGSAGTRPAPLGGWMQEMLQHYRIVMLDERGTGQSHPMDSLRVSAIPDTQAQAAYLSCFRADYIVADAELLRRLLQADEKWAALGQSFGGFCITSYLSLAPSGLSEAFITAGLPSTFRHADEVYKRTWASLEKRNAAFFREFPEDETTCWEIAAHLAETAEYLPTGERLTPRRFRMIGANLGWSYGFEKMHYLLEDPFIQLGPALNADGSEHVRERRLSTRFLNAVGAELSFAETPLYWALHESIYAQEQAVRPLQESENISASSAATAWSAQRIRESFPQFRVPEIAAGSRGEAELRDWADANGFGFRFSCEHVFQWQGEEDPALRGLASAAELIANFAHFPSLHNPAMLAHNTVPVVAWIYRRDMFVPYELSMETAAQIRGLQPLISETYDHDALRTHSKEVIDALMSAR